MKNATVNILEKIYSYMQAQLLITGTHEILHQSIYPILINQELLQDCPQIKLREAKENTLTRDQANPPLASAIQITVNLKNKIWGPPYVRGWVFI